MTYSIPPAIEANSLSSITDIAANPPANPRVADHVHATPLVLYIARVPGSRDVFLTPLKPRDKVVSAEDVMSALYYVHINSEQDEHLLEARSTPSSVNANATSLSSIDQGLPIPQRRSIQRRSIGSAGPPYPDDTSRPPYPDDNPRPSYSVADLGLSYPVDLRRRTPSPDKSHQIVRKPVLTDITNSSPMRRPESPLLPEIPRRPLPPLPQHQPSASDHVLAENVRLSTRSHVSEQLNPYVRKYSDTSSPSTTKTAELGSLTLIRRDPSTSLQWNVASIHDPPVEEISSTVFLEANPTPKVKKSGAPLYLDITNEGYTQFISSSEDRSDSRASLTTASSDSDQPPQTGVFRRRLYMPGSRHADHGYGNPTGPAGSMMSPRIGDDTPHASLYNNRMSTDGSASNLTSPFMDRRSKGYAFLSPWHGQCEFSSSTTGKALKCRHSLPNQQGVTDVSELRFNLPTTHRVEATTPTEGKRASYFSGLHRRMRSDESWEAGTHPTPDSLSTSTPSFIFDDDGKLDLRLGQEKAGGGFGGKQAKLGKLIVQPDGLAMLDLLVAANVGLWWRAWERMGG